MTKLYLDIDGTLVGRGGVPAQGLTAFLRFATERFDCYWLTTHCQEGDAKLAFLYLVGRIPGEALPYIEQIKPTTWKEWKTEAIDFSESFFWLDDNLFEMERRVLAEHNALGNFIRIDLVSNPHQLSEAIEKLDLISSTQKTNKNKK